MEQAAVKIDIDPKKAAISWGGGIDDTLGVALLIEQYGASNLNVHLFKRLRLLGQDLSQLHTYTEEIKKALQINDASFTVISESMRQNMYRDMPNHPNTKYAIPELAAIAYYMMDKSLNVYVRFSTEEDFTRTREDLRALRLGEYYIPSDHEYASLKPQLLSDPSQFLRRPFMELGVTRGDVIDMYYERNLEHLLPLTRSCGVQINQEAKNTSIKIMPSHVINNIHCGVCPRCLKRKYAFKSHGVKDPTKYIVE